MDAKAKKKLIFLVLGLLVLCPAIFLFLQWQSVNTLRENIRNLTANPPEGMTISVEDMESPFLGSTLVLVNPTVTSGKEGDRVTGRADKIELVGLDLKEKSFLSQSVVVVNPSVTYANAGGNLEFSAAKIELVGLNPAAFQEGAGVMQVMQELRISGLGGTSPGMVMRIGTHHLEDLRADLPWVLREGKSLLSDIWSLSANSEAAQDKETAMALFGKMASVLKAYETVSVARVSTTGQTVELDVDGDKLSLSVDSSELLGYSLRETGPFTLKDLSVSLNGEKMVSCERIGWDKIQLPSYADLLLTLSEGALTMDPAQIVLKFSEMLQNSPMAFNNVSVRNVTVRNLLDRDKEQREKTIFSLAESKLSYTMTDSSNDLALHLTNLAIARLLFEDELPDSALAVLPETLVFSGGLETAVNASEASTLSLDCKNISLAVQDIFLAELSFALEGVPGVQTIFLDAPMDARLAKLDLSLSDLALSDFIFAIGAAEQSEHSDGETKAETIRNEAVTLVRAGGESLQPEPLRELASNVALFLTKSGQTFTLALHPPKPVSLKQLDIAILSNPDAFGVSSSVTAPN